jgi:hypothetical protein
MNPPPSGPYRDPAIDRIYDLLFCDDPAAFAPAPGLDPAPWQAVLYAQPTVPDQVRALAADPVAESRVRALACNWLRAHGHDAPAKELLGVIVEVPLDDGLDVLAAYADGGVRYLNHTGAMTVVEGADTTVAAPVAHLLAASRAVIARIGPWDKARLPPPQAPALRMTFLVTDGLYFGEGPMQLMQREPLAAPVVAAAIELLQAVVALARR